MARPEPVELQVRGRQVQSIFQLLGDKENDMSYSVRWALARSPAFLRQTLAELGIDRPNVGNTIVRLQQADPMLGITDLEIESPGEFHLIFEAKRGWDLPEAAQLTKYAGRLANSAARIRKLIALTECSAAYASHKLESLTFPSASVASISWQRLAELAINARTKGTHAEKRVLLELHKYLGGLVTMQKQDSNLVYVVSISRGTSPGWHISFMDIVLKQRKYIHPVGVNKWPKEPPNYIAFRYDGKLQSIHHIASYEVITNLNAAIREIPDTDREPHFIYSLGPGFRPRQDVPAGKIWPSGRVWCMLDTLFTSATISEARDVSLARGFDASKAAAIR